jgi:sec-independent protein translocase protein TatB
MFGQLGWGEVLVLVVVGLFVFGPERLPTVIRDVGRVLRQLRDMASGVRDDLKAELGPEMADLDLKSLHPRSLVEKHLLSDPDEPEDQPVPLTKAEPAPQKPRLTKDATPYDADAT